MLNLNIHNDMQSFFERCQNWLQATFLEQIAMRLNKRNQERFMREAGLKVKRFEQGYTTAVAAISSADWALEFPHPVPPNMHVSLIAVVPTPLKSCLLKAGRSAAKCACLAAC